MFITFIVSYFVPKIYFPHLMPDNLCEVEVVMFAVVITNI